MLAERLGPLAQKASRQQSRAFHHHGGIRSVAGGLLRSDAVVRSLRRGIWPAGYNTLHNAVATRNASFARAIPKLAMKLVRVPAMFGGAMVAGLAYIQYQATQAGTYAMGVFRSTSDAVGSTVDNIFNTTTGILGQTTRGFEKTKEELGFTTPEWLRRILRLDEAASDQQDSYQDGSEPPKKKRAPTAATIAASASAFGYEHSDDDDPRSGSETARDDQMMLLTKKMIEIRNLLQTVGQGGALTLPSIVVIGSQSSGKSSVLEAVVGHEFLPKGSNMVTRRPIELTLVNTPGMTAEYGEFPSLGLGKITDFAHIQRTLTELNLAVPAEECVTDDPIQLTISSPHVPDLSLIDLPGYIQVVGEGQPLELKQKIVDLCDRYIQAPNIILAISAADVDLANSTALRASRRVDPRGERTIGVVTKMDLVDAPRGASILGDRKYPLRLGYVGVVCKVPQTTGIFKKGSENITSIINKNEKAYFSSHPLEYGGESGVEVGTITLRTKLMQVLEQTMAASLQTTSDAIHQELEEATYEFKVQYNDRPLSAESYLAESLDGLKHSFKEFAENFGRPEVRNILKLELDQRVLDLLAARYWNKPITSLEPVIKEPESLADLPKADPDSLYWRRKLDASTSALTKLGVGRLATTVVSNAIQAHVDRLVEQSTFSTHPQARQAVADAASDILNEKFYSTSDQVENCIKPYKFEIDVEDGEWARGRENISGILKKELSAVETATKAVEAQVGGRRKLQEVIKVVERCRKGDATVEGHGAGGVGGFSASLIQQGLCSKNPCPY
jgi:replication fork clamp-binding protein CrfC